MSLQEAASSGSFNPHVARPSETQRTDTPFDPPIADDDVDRASSEPTTPFGHSYDYTADAVMGDGDEPDLGASRRRAWTVVGLAIIIPAAVAGLIAWQLFGGEEAPAPTVTRVTTTPVEPVTPEVQTAAAEPVQATVSVKPDPSASSAATTTTSAAAVTTTGAATTADGAAEATIATTGPEVDSSALSPAARLAAWAEVETIEVLPGETLWLIAQNYNTTISAIATLNGIENPEMLSVGQELRVPVGFAEEIVEVPAAMPDAGEAAANDAGTTTITMASTDAPTLTDDLANWQAIGAVAVEDGDSLDAIALANDTTVEAIMALNGIADPNMIYVGDTLLVPVGFNGDAGVTIPTTQEATVQATSKTDAADGPDLMETEGSTAGAENEDLMEE